MKTLEEVMARIKSVIASDEEIAKASLQFSNDQGQVPTAVAYQAGARWAREMQQLRESAFPKLVKFVEAQKCCCHFGGENVLNAVLVTCPRCALLEEVLCSP